MSEFQSADPMNPYQSNPNSLGGAPQIPVQKPSSATAFAILSLIFGIGGLLVQGAGLLIMTVFREQIEQMAQQPIQQEFGPLQIGSSIVTLGLSFWLTISGFRLFSASMPSRSFFMTFCIANIVARPVLIIIGVMAQMEAMQQNGQGLPDEAMLGIAVFGGVMGLAWGIAYEVVGLIVLTRPGVVATWKAYNGIREA